MDKCRLDNCHLILFLWVKLMFLKRVQDRKHHISVNIDSTENLFYNKSTAHGQGFPRKTLLSKSDAWIGKIFHNKMGYLFSGITCRMKTLKLYIRVLVGRALWISNRINISHRFSQFYRALKLTKQATEPVWPMVMILNWYIWVQPLPPSDRVKNVHCYTM